MSSQSKGKKNKQGDRGSTEESPKVAKKPNTGPTSEDQVEDNMADNETTVTSQEEPTLLQLRDILTDLQESVAVILKENINLKEELSQIKASFQSQGRDLDKLKKSLEKVTNENTSLKCELDHARKKTKRTRGGDSETVGGAGRIRPVQQEKPAQDSCFTRKCLFVDRRSSLGDSKGAEC